MAADYIIRQGETLTLSLIAVEGDTSTVISASAKIKKAGPNQSIPPATEPVAGVFSVNTVTNGWEFTLTDEQTAFIATGIYAVDASLALVGGDVKKTNPVFVDIKRSVT